MPDNKVSRVSAAMKLCVATILALAMTLHCHLSNAQSGNNTDDKSLLWRISGNNLSEPSYLMGTIHEICPDDYLWTRKMKKSLANSDEVCFEIDFSDASLKEKTLEALVNKSGKMLEDYFTPAEYKTVYNYFKDSMDIDISRLRKLSPVILQILIIKKVVGCAHPVAYELNIMKTAKEHDKPIVGLETVEQQMDILESIPPEKTVSVLMRFIQSKDPRGQYSRLVAAYKDQDLPELYNMMLSANNVYNTEVFLNERNKKWIPLMMDKMQNSSIFFAVGAGHLWGDSGVINLLRKEGFTVEPLRDTVNIYHPEEDTQSGPDLSAGKFDKKPVPPFNLNEYLVQNLHYPSSARRQNIEGKVIVQFIVNEDGSISDATVIKGIGGGCEKEALRVINNMPAWKPATKKGVPIKAKMFLPISFKLG